MNSIFLKIVDELIGIEFKKTSYKLDRKKIINFLLNYFNKFITKKKEYKESKFSLIFKEFDKNNVIELGNNFYNLFLIKKQNKYITNYYVSSYEIIYIIRKIILDLFQKNKIIILHASSVYYKKSKKVYAFVGPSSSGKSTILKLLIKRNKNLFKAYTSDTLLIKENQNKFLAYQNPFYEKDYWVNIFSNKGFSLGSIFFIKKSKKNSIEKITDKKKIKKELLKSYSYINKNNNFDKFLKLLEIFINKNNFYLFYFNKNNFSSLIIDYLK